MPFFVGIVKLSAVFDKKCTVAKLWKNGPFLADGDAHFTGHKLSDIATNSLQVFNRFVFENYTL